MNAPEFVFGPSHNRVFLSGRIASGVRYHRNPSTTLVSFRFCWNTWDPQAGEEVHFTTIFLSGTLANTYQNRLKAGQPVILVARVGNLIPSLDAPIVLNVVYLHLIPRSKPGNPGLDKLPPHIAQFLSGK